MPQIQVLGREQMENNQANQSAAIRRQELAQDAYQKSIQFKQMAEQLKLQAKGIENDVEKMKIERLGHRMNYMSNVFKMAVDNPNPSSVIETAVKLGGEDFMNDMSDPTIGEMIKNLQPSGGAQLDKAIAGRISGQPNPALGDSDQGAPNQSQMNAIAGGMPGSNEMLIPQITRNGVQMNFPQDMYKAGMVETAGREAGKPLNMEESRTASAAGTIDTAIENISKLIDKGALKGLGSQTMTDLGNPLLASGMPDITREALQSMNQLKNLIPFARGGKQLTPYEAKLVFRLLNTQGKTPSMIKRDLNVYKKEFNSMVKSMTTPRGLMDFGGGKSYEELTGNKEQRDLSGSGDPLGLFGG